MSSSRQSRPLPSTFQRLARRHSRSRRRYVRGSSAAAAALLVLGSLASAFPAAAASRGYRARACGFDRNGDGVAGERARDCNVCDGAASSGGQPQLYVDCDASSTGNGAASRPYNTLGQAIAASREGGIICFRGTCKAPVRLQMKSGAPGHYTRTRAGSEVRGFEYPLAPWMIAGWDADDDGCYPPYDDGVNCGQTADVAVIDGKGALAYLFLPSSAASRVELAHFTVRDYGSSATSSSQEYFGFVTTSGRNQSHWYVHDLDLRRINRAAAHRGGNRVFGVGGAQNFDWFAVENVSCTECGGFFLRGGQGSGPAMSQFWRFKNVSYTGRGCNRGREGCTGDASAVRSKVTIAESWGALEDVEWLDSTFDARIAAWDAGEASGIQPGPCSRGWHIVNNEFRDFGRGVRIQPQDFPRAAGTGVCDSLRRPIDDMVIDRNWFDAPNSDLWSNHIDGVVVIAGEIHSDVGAPFETVRNLTIRNNLFTSRGRGFGSCINIDASHAGPCSGGEKGGTIQIAHNTCRTKLTDNSRGAVWIKSSRECGHPSFSIRNNLFAGLGAGDANVHVGCASCGADDIRKWDVDHNVYAPNGSFTIAGAVAPVFEGAVDTTSLTLWRDVSNGDAAAKACAPRWRATGSTTPPPADGHLADDDGCAVDAGKFLTTVADDGDGELRPVGGGNDAGYDEIDHCPPLPSDRCREAMASSIKLSTRAKARGRRLRWKWQGSGPGTLASFGEPMNGTAYKLCIYDASQPSLVRTFSLPASAAPSWKLRRDSAWEYRDRGARYNGLRRVQLKATPTAAIVVQAGGAGVPVPAAPPEEGDTPDVTVQLLNDDDVCWSASYGSEGVQTRNSFKAAIP